MFAMQRTHSASSTTSTNSSLSLSAGGWSPKRPTISPPTTTTSPYPSSPVAMACYLPVPTGRSRFAPRSEPSHPETFCPATGHGSYAYPCWPSGDSLSPSSNHRSSGSPSSPAGPAPSSHGYAPPSSRISDDDLTSLDFSRPGPRQLDTLAEANNGASCAGISWSQVGCGAPSIVDNSGRFERRRRLAPPPTGALVMGGERRRSKAGKRSRSNGPAAS